MNNQSRHSGRDEWIRQTLDRFEGPLIRYAMKITGDLESARDVVQETFLKLLAVPRRDIESRLAPWLFTVCRNGALDSIRRGQRMKSMESQTIVSQDPQAVVLTERKETATELMRLVGKLPKNQQEVLRLKFQNGLSYCEIGEVLGLTMTNVGYLIHVALKTLRLQVKA
jgi:RNA polymerase sigma factor (sigma-70 family)